MSEISVVLRPELADRPPIRSSEIDLEVAHEGTVLHLLSRPGNDNTAQFIDEISAKGLLLRVVSRGQWFAVGTQALTHADLKELSCRLEPKVRIVDQSHGRVRILLGGSRARQVLAKGSAVDFADRSFQIGHSATTLIGHITAHVTRTERHIFELIVLRTFAENLWDELERMCQEFS